MKKILIIQTAFIGDAILTLPMIQKLKELYTESEIDVLAIPATAEIFSASEYVSSVLIIDKKGKDKSPLALLKFTKNIKAKKYDVIYSPHRSLRTSLIVFGAGVKDTYGFSNSSLRHVYRNLIKYEPGHHEVRRNLELIGYSKNENDWKIFPRIKASTEAAVVIDQFLSPSIPLSRIAAVAPGSVWNTKIYPEEYYNEIINYLNKKGFFTIIIGGGKDQDLCNSIFEKNREYSASAAGLFSLIETIELLKRAKILISNDSAPTHMGICAGIPVLTLYCSTVPDFGFFPYNDKSSYLSFDNLECKPCGIHGYQQCPIKTFACGLNLKPQLVKNKLEEMLNDKN